jgi:hypothetical protein
MPTCSFRRQFLKVVLGSETRELHLHRYFVTYVFKYPCGLLLSLALPELLRIYARLR